MTKGTRTGTPARSWWVRHSGGKPHDTARVSRGDNSRALQVPQCIQSTLVRLHARGEFRETVEELGD